MRTWNIKRNLFTATKVFKNLLLPDSIPYLILFLTDACNARCKMCFSHQGMADKQSENKHPLLTIDDIEKLLLHKRLKNLLQFTLSGGEPFLRPDLEEIVRMYARLHPHGRITIPTNGLLCERILEIVERLVKTCNNVNISVPLTLLGVGEHHDYISGVDGHFTNLEETIELLQPLRKYSHFSLNGIAVLSSFNQTYMPEIMDYFKDNASLFDGYNILYTRGNARDSESRNIEIDTYRKNRANLRTNGLMQLLIKGQWQEVDYSLEHSKMRIHCNAGRKLIVVGERGDVMPCELIDSFTNPYFGNLFDYNFDLDQILNSEKADRLKTFIKDKKCYCTFECAIFSSIIFSPGNYYVHLKTLKSFLRE